MSIATTIIIVAVFVGLYYTGMIGYDLYVAKIKKEQSDEINEEAIDVSGQLDDFVSHTVTEQDEPEQLRKALFSWVSKGVSPEKMNRLMEDAAAGTQNAELKNILFLAEQPDTDR